MADDIRSFAEFWPHYLRAHLDRRTRACHYVGTSLGAVLLLAFLLTGEWWFLVGAPIAGYAFAWFAHGYFERNRPATFGHPLWSLVSDFYMLYCWATGRLDPELKRAAPKQS